MLPKLSDTTLSEWQAKSITRVNQRVKSGNKPQVFMKLFGPGEIFGVTGASDSELMILVQNNPMPVKWEKIGLPEKISLAKSMVAEDSPESLLLVSVFLYGQQEPAQAEDFLARAALLDAAAAKAVKSTLVMP